MELTNNKKNFFSFPITRKVTNYAVAFVAVTALGMTAVSCNSENVDDEAMYTFTGETVASFCKNTPELSMFYNMMEACNATSLLSVYGHYTCFPPTNDAINIYLEEKGITWDDLTVEMMQKIVYSSTIRHESTEYESTDFEEGSLATPSLSDRFIVISFRTNDLGQRETVVNKTAVVLSADNEVHNGVVHVVDRVIEPSEETFLQKLASNGNFNIWAKAYEASGYWDDMLELYDPNYTPAPDSKYQKCKLGYTVFCEPDELLKKEGIAVNGDTLESLERFATKYYGSQDLGNYESENNPLNKFVAYHILNRQMSTSSFVYTGFATAASYKTKCYEYYETMLKYRLMEIKAGNLINTQRTGKSVTLDEVNSNIEVANGFIHTLNDILVYDEDVMTKDVLHKRIRFDFYAVPPQLTNNNIRWQLLESSGTTIPSDFCGEYFWFNSGSTLTMWASNNWTNYQADEMLISGPMYDFKLRMLPVPPGNYEIRLGYRAESWRGIAQLFVDGQIAGIPVDLTIGYNGSENDPRIGYVHDEDTKDNGVENDKMMRNHGYMKAPSSIYTGQEGGKTLRDMSRSLRIIIGQYRFDEYGPHEFRAKNMDDKGGGREFHADYLEYIPVDMIRYEDRE